MNQGNIDKEQQRLSSMAFHIRRLFDLLKYFEMSRMNYIGIIQRKENLRLRRIKLMNKKRKNKP